MTKKALMSYNYNNYTPEEQAEAYVFPVNLTAEERKVMDAEMNVLRMQQLAQMPKAVKVRGQLLGLKFRMEDYVKQKVYNQSFAFGACVQLYLDYLEKTPVELAAEIQVSAPKLAMILKNQVHPNPSLAYRLEKHSGKLIPALLWWQLVTKKMEYEIENDTKNRKRASKKLHFELASK